MTRAIFKTIALLNSIDRLMREKLSIKINNETIKSIQLNILLEYILFIFIGFQTLILTDNHNLNGLTVIIVFVIFNKH